MNSCKTLLLGFLLWANAAQGEEPLREIARYALKTEEIYAGSIAPSVISHEFGLTLVSFAGTGWRRDIILPSATTAAKILTQCGVSLSSIEWHELDGPEKYKYFFVPVSTELVRQVSFPKPTVYFVKDTLQPVGFDAEAIGKSNSLTRPELRDTIWVAYGARDLGVSLAHELAHVLMDSGKHVNEPDNLMNEESSLQSLKLSPAQCERMRVSGSENGLLQPVAR